MGGGKLHVLRLTVGYRSQWKLASFDHCLTSLALCSIRWNKIGLLTCRASVGSTLNQQSRQLKPGAILSWDIMWSGFLRLEMCYIWYSGSRTILKLNDEEGCEVNFFLNSQTQREGWAVSLKLTNWNGDGPWPNIWTNALYSSRYFPGIVNKDVQVKSCITKAQIRWKLHRVNKNSVMLAELHKVKRGTIIPAKTSLGLSPYRGE